MASLRWLSVIPTWVCIAVAGFTLAPGHGATAAFAQPEGDAPSGAAAQDAPTVDLTRAVRVDTAPTRVFVGRVAPLNVVDLAFQVSGQILEMPIVDGQRRARGALIARLDTTDFELALEHARATFDLAEIEFNRSSELADRGVAAQAGLDQALANKTQAAVSLREAERRLSQATIIAPFDALVARVIADPFINTTPSQPVVRLQDVSEMRIVVSLPEEIAAQARADDRSFTFTATFPAAPDYEATLALREFSTEVDPIAQTYRVEFAITGALDPRLLPGLTAKVTGVPAAGAQPVMIPVEAIDTTTNTEPQVWVFDQDRSTVNPRKVRLGLPRDGHIVVLSGLSPDEQVVSAGWTRLTDGARVSPSRR